MSENKTTVLFSLPRKDFERLRKQPRFVRIFQLGRIVNTLRYILVAGVAASSEDDSSARRQRIASFLYVAGVLYEAFRVADVLGKDFKTSGAFRDGFARLLKKPDVVDLRQGILNDLRNKAVFHTDNEAVQIWLC